MTSKPPSPRASGSADEWVLRYSYGFPRQQVSAALQTLVRLEGAQVEDAPAVVQALDWHARGLDFADALHLASCPTGAELLTFDQALVRKASALRTGRAVRVP